jgi:predicted O-methyltransferase YrrM
MPLASLKRSLRNRAKGSVRTIFEIGQRLGIDILPRHFYSNVPDVRSLRADDRWMRRSSMVGIAGTDPDGQLEFVREVCQPYAAELAVAPPNDIFQRGVTEARELGYGPTEAEFLYCFIASKKPGKVVQVGCGFSTGVILRAMKDAGHSGTVVCVEPFPSDYLRDMDRGRRIKLIPQKAQEVELSQLTDLGPGDLLFIDSSHSVAPGSEVIRIILEVMPRLAPGVFVHFHDIFFPYTYSRGILSHDLFFWNESLLLQALLTDNPRYRIAASLSMLHYARPQQLGQIIPHYAPAPNHEGLWAGPGGHFPSATYLQRTDVP